MYKSHQVAVVIPAYNEERLIGRVIETLPEFVDRIVVVNDCSKDKTSSVVSTYVAASQGRVVLIDLPVNQGVGGAIAAGFKWVRDHDIDIAVTMDGDNQMDPVDLPHILDPIAEGWSDFAKGNRFMSGEAFEKMPKVRFFGNATLSLLTKIASGYWHVADSQTGYSAIRLKCLKAIDWDRSYKRYGRPNDLLVSLNIHNFRVCDIPVKVVYGVGEISTMKVRKVLFSIGWLLVRLFAKRMTQKYVIRDFHPLVFFYFFGVALAFLCLPLGLRLALLTLMTGNIPKVNFLTLFFCALTSLQFILFAMWFDMESNRDLKAMPPERGLRR